MDMKRILQAFDGASTKPVEGASDMSKFLRIVSETDINQPQVQVPDVPAMPDITGLQPGARKDLEAGANVTLKQDGTVDYSGGFGTFIYDKSGKALKYITPRFNGSQQTVDLTSQAVTHDYNAGPLAVSQTKDASGKQTNLDTSYNLGPAEIRHQVDASGNATNTAKVPDGDTTHQVTGNEFTGASQPVSEASMSTLLSIIEKNDVSILNEGSNPHKVALPVQMAMQHYQQVPIEKKVVRGNGLIAKYFAEAEEAINNQEENKKQLMRQYASVIAERVRLKESALNRDNLDMNKVVARAKEMFAKGMTEQQVRAELIKQGVSPRLADQAVQLGQMNEAPIDMTGDPNDPIIHGHEKANPMSLKGRIMQARAQLKDLADRAQSDDLLVWQSIVRDAKGGMFMGLEQNLEQIRHGISELAAKRKHGGIASRGIDKNISE